MIDKALGKEGVDLRDRSPEAIGRVICIGGFSGSWSSFALPWCGWVLGTGYSVFRVLGRFGLLAAVVVLTLCVSLLSGITSPHVDLLDVASASPADDDAVPANPLPSAPGMADPAERWDALPSAAAELPDAAMAVVAPDAARSEVPGVPVEIRASEEATDLEAVEGGEDDVVEPVDTPPDAPDVVVAVDSLEDPALGALVIDVEQTDGVSTLDPADDGEPVPLEPTPTESPTAVPAPSETPHGDASSDGSSDGVSDGVAVEPVSQAVEVALDYSGFASLFGGGWADRLQVIAYPECYLTTPELEGCSAGVVIPSVNDVDAGSLQFTSLDLATDTTALVVEGEASISPDASESPSPSPDSESTPEPTTMAVDVKNNAVSCFTKGDVGGCVNTTLTLAGGAGVAVKAVKAARAGKRANDAAELAAKSGDDLTRVGRWMSQTEYDKMLTSGRVIEGGGGRTYVVRPPNPNTYKPGKGVYAEFDVPTSSLHPAGGNPNYAVIPGPNAGTTRFGPLPDQMPRATCIVLVCRR